MNGYRKLQKDRFLNDKQFLVKIHENIEIKSGSKRLLGLLFYLLGRSLKLWFYNV